MSEFMVYDKSIVLKYFVEVFFSAGEEPECSVNPILGPEIIKKHLERESRNQNNRYSEDYDIPIKLMDAAGKAFASINFAENEQATVWKIIFSFDFIEDLDEFMIQTKKLLGDRRAEIHALYSLNCNVQDKVQFVREAENLITVNLDSLSAACNEIALEEENKEKADFFFLLDYVFAEAAKKGGELIDYILAPSADEKNIRLTLIFLFREFNLFRKYLAALKEEENCKKGERLS